MDYNAWYEDGMTPQEYVSSMTKYQEDVVNIYDEFEVPSDDAFFKKLYEQDLRVLVITEDWCGDAMLNVPILLKLAEAGNMGVRFLLRDDNPSLMEKHLTNGAKSIPIMIFINNEGEQVAVWGPRSEKMQEIVDHGRNNLPSKDDPTFKEKEKQMILFLTKGFRENHEYWKDVYTSMAKRLKSVID
ncbi:thioredoxin [Pontibacillus halophilus JSM 076056 = DSM 19796]|uniref:Thioredoxin n=1 Tax=Pontibacillus halophilus JSM 076056 = DSM 19796 TaxID=1385510 RepID=A0A0A5GNZ1_9BACI|nr:thioredoxin family protein [Pontibacillus halophilus]KGX92885.1 thioredoxin [Pontibacillus halophilus JSM 076056 = DSM 19796]